LLRLDLVLDLVALREAFDTAKLSIV